MVGSAHETFGPYRLLREIASGGMATVYEATGPLGERVAVKRIHPHLAKDRAFVEMFLDEVTIAARIEHPNVCRVLDAGSVDGSSYLAMELLEGRTLHQVLAAFGKHPEVPHLRFVLAALADAAAGLHAAHELRGADGRLLDVVHRDVSPQNLFVTLAGEVKVVDFGIASARDKNHRTETGDIKGKLAYMAPEQTSGRVDRRADVWALGVVLWEAITLKRLFRRATQPETLAAVERDPIPRPSSIVPEIPAALDALVLAALERDRAARLPDAATFGERVRAIGDSLGALDAGGRAATMRALFGDAVTELEVAPPPEPATKVTQTTPAPRPWRPSLPMLGAGAVLLAGAGLVGLSLQGTRGEPTVPVAPAVVRPADTARTPVRPEETRASEPAPEAALTEPTEPAAPADPPRPPRTRPIVEARPPSAEAPPPSADPPPEEPPPEPEALGVGRVTVPMGIAVCIDVPCDRSEVRHGPRTLLLSSGPHRVLYVEPEGPESGPAAVIASGSIDVRPDTTTVVPRR